MADGGRGMDVVPGDVPADRVQADGRFADEAARGAASLAYWSGRAPEYSALHEREMASSRGPAFARLLADVPGVCPGARVLELGCGSGMLSVLLSRAGCAVMGVDFSEEMLKQARANAQAHGVAVDFRRMDVHELALPDSSFDVVVTRNVTWVLDDVRRAYAEALRVLRPGGTFVNVDANYGRAFNAADARGEVPVHPTQTLEQLRTRNALVAELPITRADRPMWDVEALWGLGASRVTCVRDFEALLAGYEEVGAERYVEVPAGGEAQTGCGTPASDGVQTHGEVQACCGTPTGDESPASDGVPSGDAFSRASADTRARLFMVEAVK